MLARCLLNLGRVSRRFLVAISLLAGVIATLASAWAIQLFSQEGDIRRTWLQYSILAEGRLHLQHFRGFWTGGEFISWEFPHRETPDASVPEVPLPWWTRIESLVEREQVRAAIELPESEGRYRLVETASGWPFRSMWLAVQIWFPPRSRASGHEYFGKAFEVNTSWWSVRRSSAASYVPIWPGFLGNWAIFAAAIGAPLFLARVAVRRRDRRQQRRISSADTRPVDQAVNSDPAEQR